MVRDIGGIRAGPHEHPQLQITSSMSIGKGHCCMLHNMRDRPSYNIQYIHVQNIQIYTKTHTHIYICPNKYTCTYTILLYTYLTAGRRAAGSQRRGI